MKKYTLFISLIILLAVTVIVSMQSSSKETSSVTIGVILPLSGQYSSLGESERNAILLAEETINDPFIKIIIEDDGYETKKGISAYKKLVHIDGANVVVALSAPILEAIRPLAAEDNVLVLSLGESLFHEDDTVFQLMPASDVVYERLGFEASNLFSNVAVVYGEGSLWKLNADEFIKGTNTKSVTAYKLNSDLDYRTEVQKMINAGHDAVTIFMPLEDGLKFAQNIRVLDTKNQMKVICDANMQFAINQYEEMLGRVRLDGCISTSLPNTMNSDFVSRYKESFNTDPLITADYSYDAIAIVSDLKRRAEIKEWPRVLNDAYVFSGASGEYKFNNFGTRDAASALYKYTNGMFVEVE